MNDQNTPEDNDSKEKILIIPNPTLKPDVFISLQTLATAYQEKGDTVEIALTKQVPAGYTSVMPLENTKVIDKLPPQKFLLEFPNQESKIDGMQWNQNQDTVNFYISMQNGRFSADDMNFKALGAEYATIIILGTNSLTELGNLYAPETQYVFESSKVVSIGGELKDDLPNLKNEVDNKNSSLAEDTYAYMKNSGLNIDSIRAQNIFAGILLTTNNFQMDVTDAKTFITCAELMKAGAKTSEASRLAKALSSSEQPDTSSSSEDTKEDKEDNEEEPILL